MLIQCLCALASQVTLLVCVALQPQEAQCPAGWWLPEGIRRDGQYACEPVPPDYTVPGPGGSWVDLSQPTLVRLWGRLYCTKGATPVVLAPRAVGCLRAS